MPETTRLLDSAEAAQAQKNLDEAATLNASAEKAYQNEQAGCHGEANTRVGSRIALLRAETALAAKGPLEALIALEHRPSLNPDLGCRESTGTKPRCDALAEALESEFKKGFSRFPAFGSAANDIELGDDITVESLSVVDNGIGLDKRKWLVLDTVPTKVTSKPNGTVELKTEGKDQDVGGTSYATVGKLEVGNDTYDIKRGNYSVSHLKKAVLNVEIPAQDGAQAGVGKRCRFIVETKNWKRAGAAWTAKNARLLWVRDAAERR